MGVAIEGLGWEEGVTPTRCFILYTYRTLWQVNRP